MAPDSPYDRVPYTEHAYAETHPDRLAVVARLSGWSPAAVEGCRVLELGCGRGGNLLPMASSLPGATLLGVDLSAAHVEHARRVAREAGLRHVRFEAADAATMGAGPEHDFVIAHGLASWVHPDVRRALLGVVARALAPGGVAYVSVNVLPGWYARLAARDWMRAAAPGEDPRAALDWLRAQVSAEHGDHRRALDAVAARLAETDPAYVAHEYLADEQHPQRVDELLAEAARAGLVYLGDAIPSEVAVELLPEAARVRAASLDAARAQALVDAVRATAFRRVLLVRADEARTRGWAWSPRLDPGALASLHLASRLAPATPDGSSPAESFRAPSGETVSIHDAATRRALHVLAGVAPASLAFSDLARRSDASAVALATELLDLHLALDGLDLHAFTPSLGAALDTMPRACPVARWHARHGGPLTNRWHQEVRLEQPLLRDVLASLDGATPRAALEASLGAGPDAARVLDASLDALERAALLT